MKQENRGIWKFARLLPPVGSVNQYTLGEGNTRLIEKDGVFFTEEADGTEFVTASECDRRKGEFDFLIPRRRVAYRRVHGPIAGWIIGEEDIRQNRVTEIAGGCPEGKSGCYLVNFIRRAENPDSVFMVRYDALDQLEGQAESPPGIVLEKGDQNGPIKTERVPDSVLLHYLVRVLTARPGLETRQSPGGATSSGELGDVVEFIGIKEQFSPDRRVEGNAGDLGNRVIKLAGKKTRPIIDQSQVDHRSGPGAAELEYLVCALRIKSPDVAQA